MRTPTNSPFTAMAGPATWACARAVCASTRAWPRKTKHLLPMLLLLLGTSRQTNACESGQFHPTTRRCVIGVCGDPTTHNCLPNTPETCHIGLISIFVSCTGGYQTAAYTLNGRTPCGAGELFCATGVLERQPSEGENCAPKSSGALGMAPGVCFDPRSLTKTCHIDAVVAKTWTVTTAAAITLSKKCAGTLECCAR